MNRQEPLRAGCSMGWPRIRRACRVAAVLTLLGAFPFVPWAAHAQIDSREGIALQNQLYQLRQEVQSLRGEVGRGGGGGGGGDIAAQLLSRVQSMEEQVRQLRGRIDETQNRQRRQYEDMAKRIDDLTFQLNLQPGRGGTATAAPPVPEPPRPPPEPPRPDLPRPEPRVRTEPPPSPEAPPRIVMPSPPGTLSPPARPPSFTFNQAPEPMREVPPPPPRPEPPRPEAARPEPVRPEPPRAEPPRPEPPPATARTEPPPRPATRPPPAAPAPPPAAPDVTATPIPPGGKRTPEMALQEGQAALARRDYPAAERTAREVMANRTSPRAYDGQFLLAQSLAGAKQNAQAAIAFDDAYNRSRKGRHAQDALLGLAGALTAINEKKAACDTLSRLRTEFPQVRADLRDSITRTNERAGCGR